MFDAAKTFGVKLVDIFGAGGTRREPTLGGDNFQTANGGDVYVGRKFLGLLRSAGFTSVKFSATFECYQSPSVIGEYLALRLDSSDAHAEAEALREWSRHPDAIFAQAWCETLGIRDA